jgi:hypothetical protein
MGVATIGYISIPNKSNKMTPSSAASKQPNSADSPRWRRRVIYLAAVVGAYLLVAYGVMPQVWKTYVHHHPAIDDAPRITHTADGIPGDPLNVALIGTEAQIQAIMRAADWHPADALGLRSDFDIGKDTILDRPDIDAPVSSLYLFGRKEDLAFECPVGDSPKKRNHVRFWKTDKPDAEGRPLWIGAATYDERVGLSHTTGQITHHTAPDVDTERDRMFSDLQKTGDLSKTYFVDDFHKVLEGKNGGGDPWHTDGRLEVGVLSVN